MRRRILAANWKMYKTTEETQDFASELLPLLAGLLPRPAKGLWRSAEPEDSQKEAGDSPGSVRALFPEAVVCPPFTALAAAAEAFAKSPVRLGAQNLYPAAEGAYTGEISPGMLRELGCTYVILGHSERRQYFGEGNQFINAKLKAAWEAGLLPILCLGETLGERQAGRSEEVCLSQLGEGLRDIGPERAAELVVAYEPVWAIGTGLSARPDDAQEIIGSLRRRLKELYGEAVAEKVRIQYGGSVKPENIAAYLAMPDIDGALIGGAGLEAVSFAAILKNAQF